MPPAHSRRHPDPAPARAAAACPGWTARERELLATALTVVREHGYDRMTVDEVAARARASKATLYRRWPSKADLVLAAFSASIEQVARPPHTGTLRGDLLALARLITAQLRLHADTVIGILPEVRRNPELADVLQREFIDRRKALIHEVLHEAAARGEIDPAAVSDETWDLLPGYLIFRVLIPARAITEQTLTALIDDMLLPSLTRHRAEAL